VELGCTPRRSDVMAAGGSSGKLFCGHLKRAAWKQSIATKSELHWTLHICCLRNSVMMELVFAYQATMWFILDANEGSRYATRVLSRGTVAEPVVNPNPVVFLFFDMTACRHDRTGCGVNRWKRVVTYEPPGQIPPPASYTYWIRNDW